LISLRNPIPHYPKLVHSTPRHSHSIVLSDNNALIFQRKFFMARGITASLTLQKFCALDFKREFPRFSNLPVPATIYRQLSIGINQSIFPNASSMRSELSPGKKTVTAGDSRPQ